MTSEATRIKNEIPLLIASQSVKIRMNYDDWVVRNFRGVFKTQLTI